jgi:hypothetical protein
LNDASGSFLRLHGCYRSEGHAGDGHEALAHPILPLGVKRCRPRSNFVWLEIGDDISGKGSPCSLPESREVGFPVGGPRAAALRSGFPSAVRGMPGVFRSSHSPCSIKLVDSSCTPRIRVS